MGDFDENQYIVTDKTPRYRPVNPLLRDLIRWTRKTAKTARFAMMIVALILVTAFVIKERPTIHTELSMPQLHAQINTDLHFASHDFSEISGRWEAIADQMTKVFTHGGNGND